MTITCSESVPIPEWAEGLIETFRRIFRLYEIEVYTRLSTFEDKPHAAGETIHDGAYLDAVIRLLATIQNDEFGRRWVIHESAHTLQWQQIHTVDQIIDMVPADRQELARDLWRAANEQFIRKLELGLTPFVVAAALGWQPGDDGPFWPDPRSAQSNISPE